MNLVCVSESHFDLDYYGGPGLKITPSVEGKDAKVEIEAFVTNRKPGQALRYSIFKPCGCPVASVETKETKASLEIKAVHLWHGRKDPYLYNAKVELVENGQAIDNVSSRFGCRTFRVDPNEGFILNGESYPLRGVSRHQDRWGVGNALLPEHHEEDIDLIMEVGATTIRLAHDQHAQHFYDLCDEKGLVTMDRKYKKDAFYAYKAWLSDDPFVHLCGKRYIDRVEDVTKVTVYSNLPEVELFANGVSLGKKAAADHFFYFDVPNAGETKLVAVAGEYKDESCIRKVDTFNESYRLVEKGAVLNWFDIDASEGYLSLNDKMSDVIATMQGKLLFMTLMGKFLGGGKKNGDGKIKAAGFEVGPEMMSMMGGFTVLRLFTLMGGMMDVKFTKEQLLDLNAKLNKIKKPKEKK